MAERSIAWGTLAVFFQLAAIAGIYFAVRAMLASGGRVGRGGLALNAGVVLATIVVVLIVASDPY